MLTRSVCWNQQQTDQIHWLAINGLEIQATFQPDEKSKEALQVQQAGMRNGHSSPDPGRAQCFSGEKPVLNVLGGYAGRAGGAPGKLGQKLSFVGGAQRSNNPLRGK